MHSMNRSLGRRLGIVITFVVFLVLYAPILVVVVESFNSAERGLQWRGYSINSYVQFWHDELMLSSLLASVKLAVSVTTVSIFLGVILGYALSVAPRRWSLLLVSTALVGIVVPDLFIALANSAMARTLGVPRGLWLACVVQSVVGSSYVALIILARLRSIDIGGLHRAAESLGASEWRAFFDLYLPLMVPALSAGALIVLALSMQDFVYPFFLGGGGSTTLSVMIYGMVRRGVNPRVSVAYVLLLTTVITLLAVGLQLSKRRKP